MVTAVLVLAACLGLGAANPKLSILSLGESNFVLSWPDTGQPFVVESAPSLAPPVSWTQVFQPATLGNGTYSLVLVNTRVNRFFRLRAEMALPAATFHLDDTSPTHGEEMVNTTRKAIVRFDGAVDQSTLGPDSIYLFANGERVSGSIDVSATERTATFVPLAPLPPSTSVRLVVDGNRIRGRDGSLLDADGDGVPGGIRVADFQTLPLTRIAGTRFSGFVRDAYNLRPIAGVTMRVDAFPEANAVTDGAGRFDLTDMPAPEFFVHVDGTTAPNPPAGFTYPSVGKTFHTIPGQAVDFFVVYLPPMANQDFQNLSSTTNTVVGFGPGGLAQLDQLFPTNNPAMWQRMRVTYPPGSAVDDFGNAATQAIIVPVPPDRLPSPLPTFANPKLVISIQAPGATVFDVPAPITFPNLDGLAPGQKSLIYSFNHDAGRWEAIGSATVSADGLTLVSDPGVGIRAPGWHFVSPLAQGNGGGAVLGTAPICQTGPPPPPPPPPPPVPYAIVVSSSGQGSYSSGRAIGGAAYPGRSSNPNSSLPQCPTPGNGGNGPPGNGGGMTMGMSVPPAGPPAGTHQPVPIVRQTEQNGLAGVDFGTKDYLFTNDSDFFFLFFKNDARHPNSGETAIPLVVEVAFDGANGEILDGALTQTFSLDTQQAKTLRIDARDLIALTSPAQTLLNHIETDRLYAARCRVTARAANATEFLVDKEVYVFRFLDAADADHGDGTIDMLGAAENLSTERGIDFHFGNLFLQNLFALEDREHFDFDEVTRKFEFRPRPVPLSQSSYGLTTRVAVQRLVGSRYVAAGHLTLRGDCKLVTYYIDQQAFRDTMVRMSLFTTEVRPGDPRPLPVLAGSSLTPVLLENSELSPQAIASTKANLASPSIQSSLLNLVRAYLRDFLAPLNQGSLHVVEVTNRASADIVIDVFHTALTRLTCAELDAIFRRRGNFFPCEPGLFSGPDLLGPSLGLPFVPSPTFPGMLLLQADHRRPAEASPASPGTVEFASFFRANYNRNEQNFRLSQALNSSEKGVIDLFLEKFLTVPLIFEEERSLMQRAETIATYLAHLLGHQIGLVDTRYTRAHEPFSSVALPGPNARRDLMNDCDYGFAFDASLDTARIALGLDSDPATFDRVYHFFQQYRLALGEFDGLAQLAQPLFPCNPAAALLSAKNSTELRSLAVEDASRDGSLAIVRPSDLFFVGQVNFGSTLLDGTGGAMLATNLLLVNLGKGPLTLSNVTFQTSADFRISPPVAPRTVLLPGATLAVAITFDPNVSGEHLALLTIENDGTSPRLSLPVRGFAQTSAGDIRVTVFTNNNAGGALVSGPPRTLERFAVISNVGLSALRISEATVSRGTNQFAIAGFPAGFGPGNPIVLNPGASLALDLTFRPGAAGLHSGEVRILSDDADSPIVAFPVAGTGLSNAPPAAHWGDDFVLLETPATLTRIRSAPNGSFHFYLPANEPYALHIFDPETGLLATSSGVAESNGIPTLFSAPVFRASSAPDADGDGLPDDIGFVIGPGSLFDFGTATSAVASGYTRVSPQSGYDPGPGYGWALSSGQTVTASDRPGTPALSALKRDFNETRDATFLVDLTNGLYDVTLTLGDASGAHHQMEVFLEGQLRGNISTVAGQFITTTYRAAVTDGRLTLGLRSEASTVALAALEISPITIDSAIGQSGELAGRFFYALEDLETGFITRNTVDLAPGESLFSRGLSFPPNTRFRLTVLRVEDLEVGSLEFATPPAGSTFDIPAVVFTRATTPDSDGDGIDDLGEFAIGTNANDRDTDHDGLSDLAEIRQRLHPFDDRGAPTGVIAALGLRGEASDVVVAASPLEPQKRIAYVATGTHGLALVDVSQLRNPVILGQLDLEGYAWDVSVDAALPLAVIAAGEGGLHVVDVSDPMLPRLARTIAATAVQVEVVNGRIYAVSERGLAAFELRSGEFIHELEFATSAAASLAREGSMLYLADGLALHAIDLGENVATRRGSLALPRDSARIFAGNNIVYLAAPTAGGFMTVDASNPDNLRLISDSDAPAGSRANAVAHNGSGIALVTSPALPPSLQVLNGANPSNTFSILGQIPLPASSEPRSITIAAGIAFVANTDAGLQLVNYLSFDALGRAPAVALSTNAVDEDPAIAGLQIIEGQAIGVMARIIDDVQVQSAEFFVNGLLAYTDFSFPFDSFVTLPYLATGPSNVTIQVRATDTGGNSTFSAPLTVNVVPDRFPPRLVSLVPTNGAVVSQRLQSIQLTFSEPMNTNTLRPENIRLTSVLDPNNVIPFVARKIRFSPPAVEFTFNPLQPGDYQLRLFATNITDAAGNALGAGEIVSAFTVRSNAVFWANPAGGFWDDPGNWVGGELPSPSDHVFISVPADVTIVHRSGTHQIFSLTSANKIAFSGGTLDVATTLQVHNTFTFERGLSESPRLMNARVLPGTNGTGILVAPTAIVHFDGVVLDTDVTLESSLLIVTNGLTLNATAHLRSTFSGGATLAFDGSQVLGGTGTVRLDPELSASSIEGYESLTIESGITIRGGGAVNAVTNLINHGAIFAEPAALQFSMGAAHGRFFNHGTIHAGGSEQTALHNIVNTGSIVATNTRLFLSGDWRNEAVIAATNSTVFFGGEYTLADIGTFRRSGGRVVLTGVLDNRGTTLTLDSTTGPWEISGRVIGGRLNTVGATEFTEVGGTFDGVILDGNARVSSIDVTNGLTVNGRITLDGGAIRFRDPQPLSGTGEIVLPGFSGEITASPSTPTVPVTIGPNLTIRGGTGAIGLSARPGTILNQGRIVAEVTNRTLTVWATNFTNTGRLENSSGGRLLINAPLVNSGQLNPGAAAAGFISVNSNFTQTASGVLNIDIGGVSTNQFDRLFLNRAATLGGTLNINLINGFTPVSTNRFAIVSFATRTNDFAVKNGLSQGGVTLAPQFTPTNLVLSVQP